MASQLRNPRIVESNPDFTVVEDAEGVSYIIPADGDYAHEAIPFATDYGYTDEEFQDAYSQLYPLDDQPIMTGPSAQVPVLGEDSYLEDSISQANPMALDKQFDMPADAWMNVQNGTLSENVLEEDHGPRGYQVYLDEDYVPRFAATDGPVAGEPFEIGADGAYDEYDVLDALEFAYDPEAMDAWSNQQSTMGWDGTFPGEAQAPDIDFSTLNLPENMAVDDEEKYSILTGGKRQKGAGPQPAPPGPGPMGPLGPSFDE